MLMQELWPDGDTPLYGEKPVEGRTQKVLANAAPNAVQHDSKIRRSGKAREF